MNNIKNNYFINCIINTFEINLDSLSVNQYGNFGIQEAIKLFGYYQCIRIINNLINNILFYASKKYSSNVICFLFNYLKNNNFSKLLKVIKIIFNEKYICINNNCNNKNKNNSKITIYQKLVTNQYSIYIIFTIIQILNDIDDEFFKEHIINKKNIVNHNNKNNSKSSGDSENEEGEKNNESVDNDGEDEKNDENNINIKNVYKDDNISFEEFEKTKKEVLSFIENNTQNKEKKKLINLMKLNKIENSFLTLKKKEKTKDNDN